MKFDPASMTFDEFRLMKHKEKLLKRQQKTQADIEKEEEELARDRFKSPHKLHAKAE